MDNLEGGLIALEHRYEVGALRRRLGHEYVYEGARDPFGKKIWIHVFELDAPHHVQLAITERLRRSSQHTSEIDAHGILRTVDYGELEEGVPFVITERSMAPSLQKILDRQGTLTPFECSQLISALAAMLEPLHRDAIFHGSISPEWIFLPEEDPMRAKLGHFELGLSIGEQRAMSTHTLSTHALSPLPPEAFGEHHEEHEDALTRAGDIYALGALAYTCLVGFHPHFQGDQEPSSGMVQIQQREPQSLEELGIDATTSDAVARALRITPDERWPSARAFALALERAVAPELVEEDEDASSSTERALTPAGATPPHGEPRQRHDEELAPDRRSTITAIAIMVALLTNIAWAMYALSPPDDAITAARTDSEQDAIEAIPKALIEGADQGADQGAVQGADQGSADAAP